MTDDRKPDAISLIHIAAPAERVWDTLTDADLSPSFFFGCRSVFGEVGEDFTLTRDDGTLDSKGVVLIREAPRHLRVTWTVVWAKALRDLPPGEVDYRIEPLGNGVCRLTVLEFRGAPIQAQFEDSARNGWSMILSGIKTWCETGNPMPTQMPKVQS